MKYGIDIVDEWCNCPEKLRGIRYFDNLDDAMEWGESHTDKDDPIFCGFMVFNDDTNEVYFHSVLKKNDSINSRFEILDL